MSKAKAELISQRKTKPSNATTTTNRTLSKSKEDVRKPREPSTDRNNLKKPISKSSTSVKKVDSVTAKSNEGIKTRPSQKIATPKSVSSKTTVAKTVVKVEKKPAVSSSSRTQSTKPVKALKPTSTTSPSPKTSTSATPKVAKLSSRDVLSKRVTKEQYFPKKFPYSSHLRDGDDSNLKSTANSPRNSEKSKAAVNKSKDTIKKDTTTPQPVKKPSRQRNMTRTLSPSEVKVIKTQPINEQNDDERPRTATLRKHSNDADVPASYPIIDDNVEIKVAPIRTASLKTSEANEPIRAAHSSKTAVDREPIVVENSDSDVTNVQVESSDEYEDDFDSYNSDFEAYSSSDSTTSDSSSIATVSRTSKSSASSENLVEMTQKRTSSAGTDEERKMDSGNYDLPDMKHKQMLNIIKEAIERENGELRSDGRSNQASLSDEGFEDGSIGGFINFADAKRKQQAQRRKSKNKVRGDELMNMIRLDCVGMNLFDMNAISYEEFMQSYGRSGTVQMSAQTGDDDLDEDVQTDVVDMWNKWTQCPIRFSKNASVDVNEQFGVGSDPVQVKPTILSSSVDKTDHNLMKRVANFLNTTGNIILHILEQKSKENTHKLMQNPEIKFSNGFYKLSYDTTPFLTNRSVVSLAYSKHNTLLTVHQSCLDKSLAKDEQFCKSLICIWNLQDPGEPLHILVSSGDVSRACFDNQFGYLVFAGVTDGSISVWDLREPDKVHRKILYEKNNSEYVLRCATYSKIAIVDLEPCASEIVSIQTFCTNLETELATTQACTLDESGVIVFWSVIHRQSLRDDASLAPWAAISLVQGLVVSLQDLNPHFIELHCYDVQLSHEDTNHLFVSSNYGVLHCLASGMKPKPKYYGSGDRTKTNCLQLAPFSSKYFLTGCANGNIQLHSRFYQRALMNLCNSQAETARAQAIDIIEWSQSRPCVFYVKDNASTVHVWDLTISDTSPQCSVAFLDAITDLKLSPIVEHIKDNTSYMAIATVTGEVSLHTLNKEFSRQDQHLCQNELKLFLNYVNRL